MDVSASRGLRPPFSLHGALLAGINHLLASAPWARQKLAPHQGKSARLEAGSLAFCFRIAADGGLLDERDDEASVRIRLGDNAWGRLLNGPEAVLEDAHIEGDAGFAEAVSFVARNLRWDAEEDLARLTGDIAAHRFALFARNILGEAREGSARLAENVREYWLYESGTLPPPEAMARWSSEVDTTHNAVNRLESRIALLERQRKQCAASRA